MRRREFIAGLGGAVVWPLAARAQQPGVPVVGVLSGASLEQARNQVTGFFQGLGKTGYIEGRNVAVEYRWANGDNAQLPALATDLVRRQVSVIAVLGSTPGALAAKAATQRIPIVYAIGTDPVQVGLAASLARPGGNLTGATNIVVELLAKCLSVMHELVPAASTIAVLLNPANVPQFETERRNVESASRALGVNIVMLQASLPTDVEPAFARLVQQRASALVVSGETFFSTQRDRIIALAARHVVPTMSPYREYALAGGLVSYASDPMELFRIAGTYAGRILMGEKPADLPVQQPARVELVINLKTAKALGLTVPETLLATADEVIQ
jgi:ABC-type uncharacterized transport system substrate-binding protein